MLRGTLTEEGKQFLAANLGANLKIKVYYTKQGKATAVAKFYIGQGRSGGGNFNSFQQPQFFQSNAPF